MGLTTEATAQRLLQQLLNEKHDEDKDGDFQPGALAPRYDSLIGDDPDSRDDLRGASMSWQRFWEDSPPASPGLRPSAALGESPSQPMTVLHSIAAHITSVERQICKLQCQYEATGAKRQRKVRRKRFLTPCSTSPKTARKKRKVQETLSPGRCIRQDDPVRQNLNCVFFDITDEEDRDQQDGEDSPASPSEGRQQGQQQRPQAAPSMKDESRTTACRAMDTEILDPSDPACLVLPSLLQYLAVDDMLAWRLTSRHTRSPRVLIQHLSEMGRLDRSEFILDFSDAIGMIARCQSDVCNFAANGYDDEREKYFDCRWWCMSLAQADATHFAESDVHNIVGSNLRSLLGHCRQCCSGDASVSKSAHHILRHYGSGGLPFVKRLIAEEMLCLMENLLPESAEISQEAFMQFMLCTEHLENVLRALEKLQRQQWVSLLVRALLGQKASHQQLLRDLKLLWRADDDPRRSYAEAEQQLRAFRKTFSKDMQKELFDLLTRC